MSAFGGGYISKNTYNMGIEIMQGLAGSLGVVLTVPVTAAAAVELVYRK